MILGALSDAGGRSYLRGQAIDNPGPFLALIGKVLPTTLAGDPNAPVHITYSWLELSDAKLGPRADAADIPSAANELKSDS